MEIVEMLMEFEERMNQRFDKIDQRLDYNDTRLNRIESNMATKSQFNSLIGILARNNTISEFEAAHVKQVAPEAL